MTSSPSSSMECGLRPASSGYTTIVGLKVSAGAFYVPTQSVSREPDQSVSLVLIRWRLRVLAGLNACREFLAEELRWAGAIVDSAVTFFQTVSWLPDVDSTICLVGVAV